MRRFSISKYPSLPRLLLSSSSSPHYRGISHGRSYSIPVTLCCNPNHLSIVKHTHPRLKMLFVWHETRQDQPYFFSSANYDPMRKNSIILSDVLDATEKIVAPSTPYKVERRKSYIMENRRAAQRLQSMEKQTQHILSQPTFHTLQVTTSSEDVQSIYLYWLSRPVRDMFKHKANLSHDVNQNSPVQHAYDIVHWFMHQFDHVAANTQERQIVANTMLAFLNSDGEAKNTGLVRLMSLFCQRVYSTKEHLANLLLAGRVHHILLRMYEDNVYFRNVIPNESSYHAILNLIGKRCRLLVSMGPPPTQPHQTEGMLFPRTGIRWSDPQNVDAPGGGRTNWDCVDTTEEESQYKEIQYRTGGVQWLEPNTNEALGGYRTTRDCVDAAKEILQQMKLDPNCPTPSTIHYSMLLSMMSHSAGLNVGMADEAYTILNELEQDKSFKNIITLYNPVLMAYGTKAAEHKKRNEPEEKRLAQQKCELIWDKMRNHPSKDPAITSDPVSYMIMIKIYVNLDEAAKAQELLENMEAAAVARSSPCSLPHTTIYGSDADHDRDMGNDIIMTNKMQSPPDPSLMHYSSVLNAWAKSTDPQSGKKAMALVRRMEERTLAKTGMQHPIVPCPDRVAFTSALEALLRGPNVSVTVAQMDQILQRLETSEKEEQRPNASTYNAIFHSLNILVQDQQKLHIKVKIAEKMEQLLYRLQNTLPNFRIIAGSQIFHYYNECLRAWWGTNASESPGRALQLLQNMDAVCTNGTFPAARPNGTTYQLLLLAVSRSSDMEHADFCSKIFMRMRADNVRLTRLGLITYLERLFRYKFKGSRDEVDDAFVEVLLELFHPKEDRAHGYVAGKDRAAAVFGNILSKIRHEIDICENSNWARRYEKLFRAFLQLNNQVHDMLFYDYCIKAWALARSAPEGRANALRLLREMEDGAGDCHPNVKTYEYVLTCLARIPDHISVNTARDIFYKMETANLPITSSLLNRFIRILSKNGARGPIEEAEQMLKMAEYDFSAKRDGSLCPDHLSYSILVEGYARSKDGLRDAERILDHMKDLSVKHDMPELLPSPKLYIELIKGWSYSASVDAIERVDSLFKTFSAISKPSNYEYSILQNAWCRSNLPDAPQQAEAILVAMQQDYENGNNPAARPAIKNFDLVIKAWATSVQPNAVERADAILKRLEDLCYSDRGAYSKMTPSQTCYQHALLGWTLSDSPDAGERAIAILNRMKQHLKSSIHAPKINQICYQYTFAAIGKSDTKNKATKCYELLEEMRREYEKHQNRDSLPTHETFRSIVDVCAACTNTPAEKDEALDVCVKCMKEYVQQWHMKQTTVYAQFLYAVRCLLPPGIERDNVVFSIFTDEAYLCPVPLLDAEKVRKGLAKTASPKIIADIARICGQI